MARTEEERLRINERQRERYRTDPEYRRKVLARRARWRLANQTPTRCRLTPEERKSRQRAYALLPENKERQRINQRKRYAEDEVYREKHKKQALERYYRLKNEKL